MLAGIDLSSAAVSINIAFGDISCGATLCQFCHSQETNIPSPRRRRAGGGSIFGQSFLRLFTPYQPLSGSLHTLLIEEESGEGDTVDPSPLHRPHDEYRCSSSDEHEHDVVQRSVDTADDDSVPSSLPAAPVRPPSSCTSEQQRDSAKDPRYSIKISASERPSVASQYLEREDSSEATNTTDFEARFSWLSAKGGTV